MYLQDKLETTFIPRYIATHDCVDTGADLTVTGLATKIPFPCDCGGRNKFNVKEFYDPLTSNIKDGIVWASMIAEFKMTVNAPINTQIQLTIEVDHPTLGVLPVSTRNYIVPKNSVDYELDPFTKILYNGDDSDAHLYGFDVYLYADTTFTLKDRSVLITQL